MKLPPVVCRAPECKRQIDRNEEKEGVVWIKDPVRKGWYWHVACYNATESFKKSPTINDDVPVEKWLDATWDYLTKVQKIDIDFIKFKSQFDNFLKKKETAKGIYFTLRYYYDVQKGDKSKAEKGIGIVPYVYQKATEYWVNLESKKQGTIAAIEKQVRELTERPVIKIKRAKTNKKKKMIDLNTIGEGND